MKTINSIIDRFLGWKLPKDFGPDCHISFKLPDPTLNPNPSWPVGTNLFTADQAKAMFEHCAGDVIRDAARYRWLRENWDDFSGQSFRGTRPPGAGGYLHHKSDPEAVDEALGEAALKEVIGKPIAEAADLIKAAGKTYRVVCQDGKHYMVTADFVMDRLDVTVDHGIVTAV